MAMLNNQRVKRSTDQDPKKQLWKVEVHHPQPDVAQNSPPPKLPQDRSESLPCVWHQPAEMIPALWWPWGSKEAENSWNFQGIVQRSKGWCCQEPILLGMQGKHLGCNFIKLPFSKFPAKQIVTRPWDTTHPHGSSILPSGPRHAIMSSSQLLKVKQLKAMGFPWLPHLMGMFFDRASSGVQGYPPKKVCII